MDFSDVQPPDWFYEYVHCLYCSGTISGYGDGTFRPNNYTTRGQVTKMVILAFHWPIYTPPIPTFTDVPPTDTFYQYIESAARYGIVSGYSNGTFRAGSNVTRGQLAKVVALAAAWGLINPGTPTFSDVPQSHPFYTYIETAYCRQTMFGYSDGTFRPYNLATRAQISKVICLAIRNQNICSIAQVGVGIFESDFVPRNRSIAAGMTIEWFNADTIAHTTTSDTGLWDSGDLSQYQSFQHTFDQPGTYPYHCSRHPSMTGTITVIRYGAP